MGPSCQHCFPMLNLRRMFSCIRRVFCTPRHRTHSHQQHRRQQRHFQRRNDDPFQQIRDHQRTLSFQSSSHSFPSGENSIQLARVTRPPLVRSRRAIGLIVRAVTLPMSDSQALYASGWTCCICLEDPLNVEQSADDTMQTNDKEEDFNSTENSTTLPQLPPIVRLRCSHTMHAHCLHTWLEKGRPACCLCNGPVYPPVSSSKDEDDYSSDTTSYSAIDTPANSSLVAEQTERTSSSAAPSVANDTHQISYEDTSVADNPTPSAPDCLVDPA